MTNRLLPERISLAGIARAVCVSETWLQGYVNSHYQGIKRQFNVIYEKKGHLTIQCDELWSFVRKKKNKQWIWLSMDVCTRKIVGVYTGKRNKKGAKGLQDSLPAVYRQCAVSYTDFRDSYARIFPSGRHRPSAKSSGKTGYIERLNLAIRQGISRLVRKTLSFSKSMENHTGAIWNFVHHYNASVTG